MSWQAASLALLAVALACGFGWYERERPPARVVAVVAALAARLGTLAGARVALLGVSFKPWTDDVRESPALVLAERLTAEGAVVVAHDPVVGTAAATVLPDGKVLATEVVSRLRRTPR